MSLQTTIVGMNNGLDAIAGLGEDETISFTGTWATGDTYTLTFTDNLSAYATQIGAGNVTGIIPTFALTFNDKLNFVAGTDWYFSEIGNAAAFNDPNGAGNGFIQLGNQWGTPENLAAIAIFQGKLALMSRRTVQIWATDPDPANYALQQILPNIGTVSGLSVQAIGDMDVYMLADNGIRSIRARVTTNNAYVEDVGSPIDAILQPILDSLSDSQKATACAITEPSANRYWVFVPNSADANGIGRIYVFSAFPTSEIAAWSTYEPSYQAAISAPGANYSGSQLTYTGLVVGFRYAWTPGANEVSLTNGSQVFPASMTMKDGSVRTQIPTSFIATATTAVIVGSGATVAFTGVLTATTYYTPQKFVVFNGQVYVRDTNNNVYLYGGSSNNTYENCGALMQTPYQDGGMAATIKYFEAVDVGFQGTWAVNFGADYILGAFKQVYNNTASSFQYGRIPVKMTGTHYAMQFQENSNGYALFSRALIHTKKGEDK